MNPNPDNPGLPRFDSSTDSPLPPRTPNPYMSSKIFITALVALIVVIFFIVAYRVYVHLFWRHRQPRATSWRLHQGEPPTVGGLDKAIIDSLPTFTYTSQLPHDEMGPVECAVCLIEFQDNDACRLLPKCNHSFHTECIDKWFLSNTTCPMCRTHTEMVDAENIYLIESTRACLLLHDDIDEQMQGSDSNPYGQESSTQMQKPRSRSAACISLHHQGIINDIQRPRSISLFGGEHDEGLGLHMRQILARTFSSRVNGRYDMVGEEMQGDVNTLRGNINGSNVADRDIKRDTSQVPKVHVQHLHLPNWQRSVSDRCLNQRQGVQYPTNVLNWGNESHPTSSLHTDHWQIGGRSLPHISMEVPKLQDGFFPPCLVSSCSSSCVSIGEQLPHTLSPLARHESSQTSSLKMSHQEERA